MNGKFFLHYQRKKAHAEVGQKRNKLPIKNSEIKSYLSGKVGLSIFTLFFQSMNYHVSVGHNFYCNN